MIQSRNHQRSWGRRQDANHIGPSFHVYQNSATASDQHLPSAARGGPGFVVTSTIFDISDGVQGYRSLQSHQLVAESGIKAGTEMINSGCGEQERLGS